MVARDGPTKTAMLTMPRRLALRVRRGNAVQLLEQQRLQAQTQWNGRS